VDEVSSAEVAVEKCRESGPVCLVKLCTGMLSLKLLFNRNLERLCLRNIKGFILNLPSSIGWGMLTIPIKRRHWIAVRAIDNIYFNLDSKLKQPEVIGEEAALKYVPTIVWDVRKN